MNLKTIFKRLVLLDLSILILSVISIFFESEVVINFNESVHPPNSMDDIIGVIALIFLVSYLINLYLLYKFKNVGKQMYLFLFIFMLILTLLVGTNAYGPIESVIGGLGWTISGAILVFLYFTPIKKEFNK
jgi:uncharacterized membrane protein